jgi:hypothetical protein
VEYVLRPKQRFGVVKTVFSARYEPKLTNVVSVGTTTVKHAEYNAVDTACSL